MNNQNVNNITTNINVSRSNSSTNLNEINHNNSSSLFKKTPQVRKFDAYQFFKEEFSASQKNLTDEDLEKVNYITYNYTN